MTLADRGGASGYVGLTWGALCGEWLATMTGRPIDVNGRLRGILTDVADIDAIPGLPAFASNRGLQNPDFLLTLQTEEGPILVAADAKFSIETAKPRQVSAEMLEALLESPGSPVKISLDVRGRERNGFFITPDYEVTHLMLKGTVGILRTAIDPDQAYLIAVSPERLFARPDLPPLLNAIAGIDGAEPAWPSDLVTALYYARCVFACAGCRIDESKPLLGSVGQPANDPVLLPELLRRAANASSAWGLVLQWDRDAEAVREARVQVHQAADLGVPNREIRDLVEHEAARLGKEAPSVSRIRRELALWTTAQLVEQFGVVIYPVADLGRLIRDVRRTVAQLRPRFPEQVRTIVAATDRA
jgi:hypothetical protein